MALKSCARKIKGLDLKIIHGTISMIEEMLRHAVEVAQEVDSQYVVTYALQRPVNAEAGEYLKIDVISRRVGLKIRARRGYLAKPHDVSHPGNQINPSLRKHSSAKQISIPNG
jgi:hypothetical protein